MLDAQRNRASSLNITKEQAQRIFDRHRPGSASVSSLDKFQSNGFSSFTATKTYVVTLSDGETYTLKITPGPQSGTATDSTYTPNTLAAEHAFLLMLSRQTDIPSPTPYALDTTLELFPYPYLLLSRPRGIPISQARAGSKLTERQLLLLDLRVGAYLKQLHGLQNDWFGLPSQERDGLYSWQEAFTLLLETLLEEAEKLQVEIAYEDVRRYLSRAIGFFLFDDCEVPSLVSFAGDEDEIFVEIKDRAEEDVAITSFLTFSHALWGDPLLEALFRDPSIALSEGYGNPLIIFARQKTKRLWYTVFLALMVLVQAGKETGRSAKGRVEWARSSLDQCVRDLRDAPCY